MIGNQRVVIDYKRLPFEEVGYPDGMCVDSEGKLWVANVGPGTVVRINQETGEEICMP